MRIQLGVIVGLVSTSVQSIGLTLQRKSHLLEEEKEDDYDRRPPYKRRRWQVRSNILAHGIYTNLRSWACSCSSWRT
jgi:hypothetical protein